MKVLLAIVGSLVGLVVLAVVVLFCLGMRPHAGRTRTAIDIARPPEQVWAWLTEPARAKQWVGGLVEIREDTPNVHGVGARETWVMQDPNAKGQMVIPSEVTLYDEPRKVSVHLAVAGSFTGDASYVLTPTATGTHLESIGDWQYQNPVVRLMEPLVTPQANAKSAADFAKLKALMEAAQ